MSRPRGMTYLADHSLLLAVPAFLPAVLVVLVVSYVARRERTSAGDEGGVDQ
ncbi:MULTISPECIES: hypothetical protein [Mycolicibacterium]|uniref:hypothetical protein n=1 Tax=Mycolicibacterium TaxID=1866885 RepID=UPI0013F4DF6B|nr:hypothetical protein [Mycolicibacterium fortuitum]NOP97182.1 hypothetical protein [Mycolicibacterium fortuitum]UBV18863.1 hypothetical protein H8Z57_26550 [Mycolicibacterium fortuitum]UHJ54169.1 hypothetical protein LT337_22105 [Mycolicibacterium fortuitum]